MRDAAAQRAGLGEVRPRSRDNAAGAFGGGLLRDLRDSNKNYTVYVEPASKIYIGDQRRRGRLIELVQKALSEFSIGVFGCNNGNESQFAIFWGSRALRRDKRLH